MSALVAVQLTWPVSALWPNSSLGRHWSARQKAKGFAKLEARAQSRRWAGVFPKDAQLVVVIAAEPPDAIRRDVDNLVAALKPSIDGLAQGLEIDDSRIRRLTIDMLDPVPTGRITLHVHLLSAMWRPA